MADVFNRAGNTLGGTFSVDAAQIVFSGGGTAGAAPGLSGGVGLLSQNAQFSYQQQVTRLYEIGSNYTFLIAGRAQGSLALGRVLGPRPVQTQFYQNYGDVCNAANNNLAILMSAGCTTAAQGVGQGTGTLAFNVKNVVIVSIGINVAAQDMIVNEQLQAMFVALEVQS
jgi:hypothetical protein